MRGSSPYGHPIRETVVEVLREAVAPMTRQQIEEEIMRRRNIRVRSIGRSLYALAASGIITKAIVHGRFVYRIVGDGDGHGISDIEYMRMLTMPRSTPGAGRPAHKQQQRKGRSR